MPGWLQKLSRPQLSQKLVIHGGKNNIGAIINFDLPPYWFKKKGMCKNVDFALTGTRLFIFVNHNLNRWRERKVGFENI